MAAAAAADTYDCDSKPLGLVLYNPHGRDRAKEEADDLHDGLNAAGCDVKVNEWSTKLELVNLMDNGLKCMAEAEHSFLIVCIMSQGSAGRLHTSDGDSSVIINDILYHITRKLKEQHLDNISLV